MQVKQDYWTAWSFLFNRKFESLLIPQTLSAVTLCLQGTNVNSLHVRQTLLYLFLDRRTTMYLSFVHLLYNIPIHRSHKQNVPFVRGMYSHAKRQKYLHFVRLYISQLIYERFPGQITSSYLFSERGITVNQLYPLRDHLLPHYLCCQVSVGRFQLQQLLSHAGSVTEDFVKFQLVTGHKKKEG